MLQKRETIILSFIKWLLYTSIFAGLCAVSFCMATERLLLVDALLPPWQGASAWKNVFSPLHGFVFANTLFIYNVHYGIKKIPAGVSDRADWSIQHKNIHWILIVLSSLLSAVCLLFLNREIFLASIFLGLLSLGYSLPILPFKNKKRLKDFGILKLMLLCFVWSCVTVLLPMLYWDKKFADYEAEFLLRFMLMMPLCIAFDIRDMQVDKSNEIYTVPNTIGLKNSYRLIDISLIIFLILAVIQYIRYPILTRLICGIVVAVITKIVIQLSKKYNSDLYHLLCIDGMMMLYSLLIMTI